MVHGEQHWIAVIGGLRERELLLQRKHLVQKFCIAAVMTSIPIVQARIHFQQLFGTRRRRTPRASVD